MSESAENKEHPPYITTSFGMSGHFAVYLRWEHDQRLGGFYDVWATGIGRYPNKYEAVQEAREWAAVEGLEYKP